MIRRALSALVVLVLLAGCGGAGGEEGTAQLWVTRDRGAELLVEAEVDAGQTLMRALAAEAEVETRYGGRYVQSVNGIEGSLDDQRDWFWFVNGYEGDRSAAVVQAARRRRRLARLPRLGAGGRGARGRRRLPGAVPPRLRRPDATRRDPLRAGAGAPRPRARARSSAEVDLQKLPAPVAGRSRTCSRCVAGRLGSPASCSARPRAIPCASSSAALRRTSGGTASREPRPRSPAARRRRHGRAAHRSALGGRCCWPWCSSPSACALRPSGEACISSAR